MDFGSLGISGEVPGFDNHAVRVLAREVNTAGS
jgi:hypothetical protein